MKNILSIIGLLIFGFYSNAQDCYWQQHVSYTIDVEMDVEKHTMVGKETMVYTNNSPDSLNKLFVHLYFNAFQPGSMMDARSRTISDPDERVGDRIGNLKPNEIGYHRINKLLVNGNKSEFTVDGTLMQIDLSESLNPGEKIELNLDFESQVPVQIRRNGRNNKEGVAYSMAQWYPKMAEYDKDGWMTDPYVGREFHGVWGDFNVSITLDSTYLLGGTGYLQNPEEIGHGYPLKGKQLKRPDSKKLTWKFYAPTVHDFAWAADPDYNHDVLQMENGPELHFIYKNDSAIQDNWMKLQPYTAHSFSVMNSTFGEYPYEQYSVIQGGDGGMEYPMATLISGTGSFGGLVSVTVHESIHSWYYGLLATNETKYPWMDEGFTQFAQYIVLDSIFNRNRLNPVNRAYDTYISLATNPKAEPLTTHADFYHHNRVYGINSYYKGATFLQQLAYIVGDSTFYPAMRKYYYTWRYKHPTPDDFKRIMESSSDLQLDWYFNLFLQTNKTIDYKISNLAEESSKTMLTLERIGELPMPVEIEVTTTDDKKQRFYIPLNIMRGSKNFKGLKESTPCKPWPWTHPIYSMELPIKKKDILKIDIDPDARVADVDLSNNEFPLEKKEVIFEGGVLKD